jgi:hypothetical protein
VGGDFYFIFSPPLLDEIQMKFKKKREKNKKKRLTFNGSPFA